MFEYERKIIKIFNIKLLLGIMQRFNYYCINR